MINVRVMKYEWDNLAWSTDTHGHRVCELTLHAGEYLRIEEGWEVEGPTHVRISYNENDKHTQVEYAPLSREEFDLDNPYEYPCASCGSQRHAPCIGSKPECTYRVFYTRGGVL